ncbi:MAG TPA: tyrosine-type recombinase/integrase [Gemmatimonadaceae bacterium]|nr:tyrosine-type recombinase/integrase [Gemmatimonadaceae bacterium]
MASNAKKKTELPYFVGEKGVNRIRLYAHAKTGMLWLDCRTPKRIRQSLGHRDVERGKRAAEQLAVELRSAEAPRTDVTLRELFDKYEGERLPMKSAGVQEHNRRARALFERCWGAATKVKDLDRRDWDRFIRERRTGALRPHKSRRTDGVRDRQIEYELRFLLAVLNWAEGVREHGRPLLDHRPFRGFAVPTELNVKQPTITEDEIAKLRGVAHKVHPQCPVFFSVVYHTGHRGKAVRFLKWSDVDLSAGTIRFADARDKIRFDHVVPIDGELTELLREYRRASGAIGDTWLFPRENDPSQPLSRYVVCEWWQKLERLAGISRMKYRGWHSLRRRFATDLDAVPMKQLMSLGGWKTPVTVMRYQKHTIEELRAGLATRRRAANQ